MTDFFIIFLFYVSHVFESIDNYFTINILFCSLHIANTTPSILKYMLGGSASTTLLYSMCFYIAVRQTDRQTTILQAPGQNNVSNLQDKI